jgi:hypothetical protein
MIRVVLFTIILLLSNVVKAQADEYEPIIVPSERVDKDYPCLFLKSEFYVIRKTKELKDANYVAIDWEKESCKKVRFPKIDFKQNVLIGLRKYIRSCDYPTMEYEITKLEDALTLDIEFTTNGNCQVEYECIYWFLLPLQFVDKKDSFDVNEQNINVN